MVAVGIKRLFLAGLAWCLVSTLVVVWWPWNDAHPGLLRTPVWSEGLEFPVLDLVVAKDSGPAVAVHAWLVEEVFAPQLFVWRERGLRVAVHERQDFRLETMRMCFQRNTVCIVASSAHHGHRKPRSFVVPPKLGLAACVFVVHGDELCELDMSAPNTTSTFTVQEREQWMGDGSRTSRTWQESVQRKPPPLPASSGAEHGHQVFAMYHTPSSSRSSRVRGFVPGCKSSCVGCVDRARPVALRHVLVSFRGKRSRPKVERNHFLRVLRSTAARVVLGNIASSIGMTTDIEATTARRDPVLSPDQYNEQLNDTVFALCPSGTAWLSYRIFESARAGAIPVVTRPPPSFHGCHDPAFLLEHTNAPFVWLNDWQEAVPKLAALAALGVPELQRMQDEVLAWYKRFVAHVRTELLSAALEELSAAQAERQHLHGF